MKYLDKTFSSPASSNAYRKNFDKVFKKPTRSRKLDSKPAYSPELGMSDGDAREAARVCAEDESSADDSDAPGCQCRGCRREVKEFMDRYTPEPILPLWLTRIKKRMM